MSEMTIRGVKITDDDVILDEFIPEGESNYYNIHPFVLHNSGFCIAVVFASNLQDAFDIAVDNDKMNDYLIPEGDYDDYGVNTDEPTCSFLGNASEPFDITNFQVIELENPPMSFCALYKASQ